MTEYLSNYKRLLELKEINEKEIQENEQLITDNSKKWLNEKVNEENLNTEIKELTKKYNNEISKKEKELLSKIAVILTLLTIIIFILFKTPLAFLSSISIYIMFFSISKNTSIFKKQFNKNKNISKLLQQININEKKLSNIKKLCDEYSQNVIKYRNEVKKLYKKKIWITDSINELMRNYATPIFEEQLKNIDEYSLESSKPKTKKKVKTNDIKEIPNIK